MATATNPSNARDEALAFFRESELPAGWSWVNDLSPLNLRLFAVELADAIKESVITGDESHLLELLADWKATGRAGRGAGRPGRGPAAQGIRAEAAVRLPQRLMPY